MQNPGLSVAALRRAINGAAHLPSDPGYDEARIGLGTCPVQDRFPDLVVRPRAPVDIVRALEFAQTNALDVSVRSGGHDLLGASTGATGMLIDLAHLNTIQIDAAAGTAIVGAGVRAGEFVQAAAPYDFVPVVGTCSNVGVGGLTLGGGIGWTSGTQGAVVDNLLAAEIVTADGQILRASADENTDLFWALRGGGGNFGVATAFTYRMPRTQAVLTGSIVVQAEAEATLRFLHDYLADSPDELEVALVFLPGDSPVPMFVFCWAGAEDAGQRAIHPMRTFAPVIEESITLQPFAQFSKDTGGTLPKMHGFGGSLDWLDGNAIGALAEIASKPIPNDCSLAIGHYMHGALCRVQADETPMIRQPGKILYDLVSFWGGQSHPAEQLSWVNDNAPSLRKVHSQQEYINYLSYDDSDLIRNAYGHHYGRLLEIKRRYDPGNIFRGNRNIVA